MKGQKSAFVYILAIASLIGIGGVLAIGFLKNKPQTDSKTGEQQVLGEEVAKDINSTPFIDVNKFVQSTFQSSKDTAQQKVNEVQKTIVNTVEKEISNFTQSQVESLKLQICRDWGVISISPTTTP